LQIKVLKISENLFVVISVQRYSTNRRTKCLLANALKLTMGSWFECIPRVKDAQGRLLSMKEVKSCTRQWPTGNLAFQVLSNFPSASVTQ